MKIKNSINAQEFEKQYEKPWGPSMTVPDQAMSVKEIMDRFVRGIPMEAGKVPIYEGEEFIPDWQKMDLTEKQEYAEAYLTEFREKNTPKETPSQESEALINP